MTKEEIVLDTRPMTPPALGTVMVDDRWLFTTYLVVAGYSADMKTVSMVVLHAEPNHSWVNKSDLVTPISETFRGEKRENKTI